MGSFKNPRARAYESPLDHSKAIDHEARQPRMAAEESRKEEAMTTGQEMFFGSFERGTVPRCIYTAELPSVTTVLRWDWDPSFGSRVPPNSSWGSVGISRETRGFAWAPVRAADLVVLIGGGVVAKWAFVEPGGGLTTVRPEILQEQELRKLREKEEIFFRVTLGLDPARGHLARITGGAVKLRSPDGRTQFILPVPY